MNEILYNKFEKLISEYLPKDCYLFNPNKIYDGMKCGITYGLLNEIENSEIMNRFDIIKGSFNADFVMVEFKKKQHYKIHVNKDIGEQI